MEFVKHPRHSLYMGAPEDWNEATHGPCGSLSIHDKRNEPTPCMESAWELSPEEAIACGVAGYTVRLNIIGHQHPPVSMHVASGLLPDAPDEPERDDTYREKMRDRLLRALDHLAAVADCNGFVIGLTHEVSTVGIRGKAIRREVYLTEVRNRIAGRPICESLDSEGD